MSCKRVVVTGYGALSSMGENSQQIWDGILNYKLGYKKIVFEDKDIIAKFYGFIEPDNQRYAKFQKRLRKVLPIHALYALVASDEALNMAFGDASAMNDIFEPTDLGVIIGTGWGGIDESNDASVTYYTENYCSAFDTLKNMNNVATAAVSMNWGMRGYHNTPVAACATGTMAIGEAYDAIRSGRAKLVLAGGTESIRAPANIRPIDSIQALSREQEDETRACCPFSKERSGFVLSDGSAVLCLEELESAKQRKATIFGEITGYGNYADAFDMTGPAEDMISRVAAMRTALTQAGITPEQLDYINAHGTSTSLNDFNESQSYKEALGSAAYNIPISSTKSYTGHLIGAAGALEAIFCLKVLDSGTIPATYHLNTPDPKCDLNYVPNQHMFNQKVDRVLNVSFGFGGSNCAVVIERCR